MVVSCGQQNQNEASTGNGQESAVVSADTQLSVMAEQHQQACEDSLKALEQKFAALESLGAPYTVASVLEPINDFSLQLADVSMKVGLMESVHPNARVREASQSCASSLADISARFSLSRSVYEALSQLDVSQAAADTQRYYEQMMASFKLSGVDKDEASRERIRALNDEIMRIGQSFDKNILDSVLTVSARPEELVGLPEDFIAAHPVVDGEVSITTRYPDYGPVMTYAESDDLRKRLRAAFYQRAYPANGAVLKDLLSKRHELALLLGKPHYAELATQDKMIGSAANVQAFIEQVATLIRPTAEAEAAALLQRLQQIDPEAQSVQNWQVGYLSNLLKKRAV